MWNPEEEGEEEERCCEEDICASKNSRCDIANTLAMMSPSDSSDTQSLKPRKVDEVSRFKAFPPTFPESDAVFGVVASTANSSFPAFFGDLFPEAALLGDRPPALWDCDLPPTTPSCEVEDRPLDPALELGDLPPGGVRVDEVEGTGDCRLR